MAATSPFSTHSISKELNLLATALVAILSLYIASISILQRPLLDPLLLSVNTPTPTTPTPINSTIHTTSPTANNADQSIPPGGIVQQQQFGSSTYFSIFLLWLSALSIGRIFHYARLPPLFGMLLVGMAFANIPSLNRLLVLDANVDMVLRKCAFVLILLRCGIGLDPKALKESLLFCACLGLLSTSVEILAILLPSHFLFSIPWAVSILFAFVLASTSPAVTVPTMIGLEQRGKGTKKGIPTMALASASIDNIFCISGFTIAQGIVSAPSTALAHTLILVPVEIFAGLLLGCFFGSILRLLPPPNVHFVHFGRTLLLCSLSLALYFGTIPVHFGVTGPIAVILACFLAASGWKKDNPKGAQVEANALRLIWDLLFLPLLFVLIGLLFDLSIFTWDLLEEALFTIFIGIFFRMLTVFLMAKANKGLNVKECLFFSSIFIPKATVQAALAPLLYDFSISVKNSASAQFTLQASILSILLTAPAGQLIIQLLGDHFLLTTEDEKMAKNGESAPSRRGAICPAVVIVEEEGEGEEGKERKKGGMNRQDGQDSGGINPLLNLPK